MPFDIIHHLFCNRVEKLMIGGLYKGRVSFITGPCLSLTPPCAVDFSCRCTTAENQFPANILKGNFRDRMSQLTAPNS